MSRICADRITVSFLWKVVTLAQAGFKTCCQKMQCVQMFALSWVIKPPPGRAYFMTPHGRVCTCHGCLFQCSHTWTLVRQIMFDTQEMANIHKLLQLTFLFAAMTGKSRLGPDPSISINDLQTQ